MNERIKELVKQAGGIYHNDDGVELTPALVGKGLEKFAELIVRECANWMEDEQNDAGDRISDSFYWSDRLKQHFGVEE